MIPRTDFSGLLQGDMDEILWNSYHEIIAQGIIGKYDP
jgi:hypothetical protein